MRETDSHVTRITVRIYSVILIVSMALVFDTTVILQSLCASVCVCMYVPIYPLPMVDLRISSVRAADWGPL